MADGNEQNDNANEAGFFAAAGQLLASFRETVNPAIESVSEPLLRDGMLGAGFRQGVDEFWQALQAFPDGVQAQEPGALLEPLQSEVAAARQPDAQATSLEDILNMNSTYQPQQSNEQELSRGM